jgi:tetratricopeptide (TPR) repeat protein
MGVARRIWVMRVALVLVCLAAWPASHVLGDVRVVAVAIVIAVFGYALAERLVLRSAWKKLQNPQLRPEQLIACCPELEPFHAGEPWRLQALKFCVASAQLSLGEYSAARPVLEALLEVPELAAQRPHIENNLAWALMHLGVVGRALELAARAMSARPDVGYYRGTYAIGLFLSGRAAEAVPLIEQVLREHAGDGAETQAIRAYYLGEALAQLGQADEARAAFERAVREAPGSSWGGKARAKLS